MRVFLQELNRADRQEETLVEGELLVDGRHLKREREGEREGGRARESEEARSIRFDATRCSEEDASRRSIAVPREEEEGTRANDVIIHQIRSHQIAHLELDLPVRRPRLDDGELIFDEPLPSAAFAREVAPDREPPVRRRRRERRLPARARRRADPSVRVHDSRWGGCECAAARGGGRLPALAEVSPPERV